MKYVEPERSVLHGCLGVLKNFGFPHWRANTGAARLPGRGGTIRLVRFGVPGCSDIVAVVPRSGRLLAVEVKRSQGGKLTKSQANFLDAVDDAGGVALVITDAKDLVEICTRLIYDPWAKIPWEMP